MKIAVVGPAYPFRGGIAHYTTLLASHLAVEHGVRLYSFQQQYPAFLFPGRSQIDPSAPLVSIEARRWLTPWWPWSWRRVTSEWSVWRPERVIIQWWVPFMAPMTVWLLARARRLGIHSMLICHNVLPHEQSRVDQAVVRWVLQRADRLIVHTTAQQALAQRLIPGCSTSVVPLPSYAAFRSDAWTRESARAQLNLSGNVLLFFGLIRPYKGLLDLLDALPAILKEVDVTLLVVGEIWGDAGVYKSRLADLKLQGKVHLIDRYVPNDEAAMYFSAADLAVLPYREATGSAVLQLAFGLGVPVVATRTGGMDEVVEDGVTGFLVEPGNIGECAHAIVRFFREECASSFRATIVRAQVHFDWSGMVDVIIDEG
jgi:glycosyltransferase involved in cell wall biosynthesis